MRPAASSRATIVIIACGDTKLWRASSALEMFSFSFDRGEREELRRGETDPVELRGERRARRRLRVLQLREQVRADAGVLEALERFSWVGHGRWFPSGRGDHAADQAGCQVEPSLKVTDSTEHWAEPAPYAPSAAGVKSCVIGVPLENVPASSMICVRSA